MSKKRPVTDSYDAFEKALAEADHTPYVLRLYVNGATVKSAQAIASIKAICEKHLEGRYTLEVIDINQQPELMESEQIIAVPTLIKKLPPPLRQLVGDMSNEERVLIGLQLRRAEQPPATGNDAS